MMRLCVLGLLALAMLPASASAITVTDRDGGFRFTVKTNTDMGNLAVLTLPKRLVGASRRNYEVRCNGKVSLNIIVGDSTLRKLMQYWDFADPNRRRCVLRIRKDADDRGKKVARFRLR